jgi:hypothetical protein
MHIENAFRAGNCHAKSARPFGYVWVLACGRRPRRRYKPCIIPNHRIDTWALRPRPPGAGRGAWTVFESLPKKKMICSQLGSKALEPAGAKCTSAPNELLFIFPTMARCRNQSLYCMYACIYKSMAPFHLFHNGQASRSMFVPPRLPWPKHVPQHDHQQRLNPAASFRTAQNDCRTRC